MRHRKRRSRGNALVEFTLVGIPLIFGLISIFELARGMWQYHTLAYAVKAGARYAIVHGQDCTILPNDCAVSISQVAGIIRDNGIGLPASAVTVSFTDSNGGVTTCTLSDCIANNTTGHWPPDGANAPGRILKISGKFPFRSAIAMFWPGAGRATAAGTYVLTATARESIQF